MSEIQSNTFIQRCPHDKQNPYVMINRALIRDNSLSPECRWLLIYLLSNTDGWKIKVKQVVNHVKGHIGRDRVYELFNEACDAGYMKREEGFGVCHYFISETPKFKKSLQFPENQDTDGQDTENQDALSKSISSKEDKKEHPKEPPNPQKEEAPDGACQKLAFGKFVSLSKSEFEKLSADHGKEAIEGLIDEMNDFLASSGKKPYRDYAAAIRQWLRRRRAQQKPERAETQKLNDIQEKNWKLNRDLVDELKLECPNKASGLNFFYKHYVLKDRNSPFFDVSGLIDHRDFCRVLGKHLKLKIEEVRFPHGKI
jgi:hypothetical protein